MGEGGELSFLQEEDWDAEWQRLCGEAAKSDDAAYWDTRAASFTVKDAPGEYVREFLANAGIAPGESVLDMGCGAGHLAIPLAEMGCHVIAADFSPRMLEFLTKSALERNIPCRNFGEDGDAGEPCRSGSISTLLLSWEDDWAAHGLKEDSVDVAISSRSIAVASLRANTANMNRVARRRCCATVSTGVSPRIDCRIFQACGIPKQGTRTHQYLMNILINDGYDPECRYVSSARQSSYNSMEEAREDYRKMVLRCIGGDAPNLETRLAKLDAWLDSMMQQNNDPRPECPGKIAFKEPRVSTWAFIGWSPAV